MDRVLAPAPANGAALNVSTGAQSSPTPPCRVELLGAPQAGNGKRPRAYGFYSVLSTQSSVLSPASTRAARRASRGTPGADKSIMHTSGVIPVVHAGVAVTLPQPGTNGGH